MAGQKEVLLAHHFDTVALGDYVLARATRGAARLISTKSEWKQMGDENAKRLLGLE